MLLYLFTFSVRRGVSVAVVGPASPRDYGKMEVDISEVLAAIGTLYDAQVHDKQKHDQASRWLGQLQRSVRLGARGLGAWSGTLIVLWLTLSPYTSLTRYRWSGEGYAGVKW